MVSYILELNLWKHRSQSSVEFFQWFWARWNAENMNFPKIYVLNFFGTFHNTYSQCAHRHNSTTRIWVNILDVFSNFLQIHQYFVRLPFSAMIASITFVWLAITSATAFLGIVFAVFNSRLCSVFWLRRDRITPAYFLKSFSFKRLWTLSHGIVSWLLGGYPPWTLWFFPADGYGLIPASSNTLYTAWLWYTSVQSKRSSVDPVSFINGIIDSLQHRTISSASMLMWSNVICPFLGPFLSLRRLACTNGFARPPDELTVIP